MTAQLALLPAPQALPAPRGTGSGVRGVDRFFDELDRPGDRLGRTRAALREQIDDLAKLAADHRHANDASFTSGVAWGIFALRRALHAAEGGSGPFALTPPAPARL